MLRSKCQVLLLSTLLLVAVSASVPAQQQGATAGRIYRLDAQASYQEGCFDPCLCPLGESLVIHGAFVLGPPIAGNAVNFHRVRDIYWTVGDPLATLHTLTGRGSYRVTNNAQEPLHSLDLTLSVDGGEARQFFSDFVPVKNDGGSLDITVSLNGVFCKDTVIRVDAAPVPPEDVLHYSLLDASTFQQGCFDPCDCPLEQPRPMIGSYDMVSLYDIGTVAGFGVTGARFVVPAGPGAQPTRLSGAGQYTIVQGFAGPSDIMALSLREGAVVTTFDSPLQNTRAVFPDVSVSVDTNDRVCFDRVLNIEGILN
jgi:hypothetical protein